MSAYFLLGLIVSALLCIALFVWLCFSLHINWSRRNKIGLSYLLPVVVSILFIGGIVFEFRPRLQDTFHILSENTIKLTAEAGNYVLEEDQLICKEQTYILSPEMRGLDPSLSYRLTAAPATHIVLSMDAVEEVEDTANSEPVFTSH